MPSSSLGARLKRRTLYLLAHLQLLGALARAMRAGAFEFANSLAQSAGMNQGIPLGLLEGAAIDAASAQTTDLAAYLNGAASRAEQEKQHAGPRVINSWRLRHHPKAPGHVQIQEDQATGARRVLVSVTDEVAQRLRFLARTIEFRFKFNPVKAELRARQGLLAILSEEQRTQYLLCDTVQEFGKSGVMYLVRRNRPTLAFRPKPDGYEPLTALCMHPDAYYEESWAGGLPPSDEVRAHLMFIRGDEYGFWKKANHIPLDRVNAGL